MGTAALDCAFQVHSALGPGLLESSYKACLAFELVKAGFVVRMEVPVPLIYKEQKIADVGYRLDLLVNEQLILEVKSVEAIAPVHRAQLLSYLRLSQQRLGYVLNFDVVRLRGWLTGCWGASGERRTRWTQGSRGKRGGIFAASTATFAFAFL